MRPAKARGIFPVVNTAIMVIIILICLFPILYILCRSVSSGAAIANGKVFLLPVGFNMESYKGILAQPGFLRSYANTLLYTAVGTVFTLAVTALCAYPLSKTALLGRKFFMAMFIGTMFFSGGLIPSFVLITHLKMTDTIWALVVPAAFNQFYIILAMGAIQGLPGDLEESAALDGLNPWQILIWIIIPLCVPVFATIALFTALGIWNDWFTPMIYITSNQKQPVMLVLKNIITGGSITTGNFTGGGPNANINSSSLKSAAIVVVMLPITAIYPFVQRFFTKGMLIGSIKG